jgi:hypothetical protein
MARIHHINPTDDDDFADLVARLAKAASTAEALQSLLRATHPHAVVRMSVVDGMESVRWYVYRDGAWVPRTRDGARHDRSVPRDADGDVTGAMLTARLPRRRPQG